MDSIDSRQAQYSGQQFKNMRVTGQEFRTMEFEQCSFDKCRFQECAFIGCKFIDCTFTDSMLSAVNVTGSTFYETTFRKSKVVGIDWSSVAKLRGLQFLQSELSLSGFTFIKLPNLVMKNCIAKDVKFMEADCSGADFEGTDFESSTFQQMNFSGANFKRAFNYSIDFRNNTIKKAKFSLPEATSLLQGLDIILED